MAAQPGVPGEGDVDSQAKAFDAFVTGPQKKRCDRAEPLVEAEWRDEPLEKVRATLDVVVQEDDDFPAAGAHAAVARNRETQIRSKLDCASLGKRLVETTRRSVG